MPLIEFNFSSKIYEKYLMNLENGIPKHVCQKQMNKELKGHKIILVKNNQDLGNRINYKKIPGNIVKECSEKYRKLNPDGVNFMTLTNEMFNDLDHKHRFTLECFASPFDNRLVKFCSLYPEQDKYYGSIGDFFKIDITNFNEEVLFINPPWIELIFQKTMNRIMELLNSKYKIDLIVFLPFWEDMMTNFVNSSFVIEKEILKKGEYSMILSNKTFVISSYDGFILHMKNF